MAKDPARFPNYKSDPSALRALVSSSKADAMAAVTAAKLTLERERADRYYQGDMEIDMPVEDGRSSAISTDVADVIEGVLPHLMDIFCGSDEVVRFEPVGPGDEQAAQQETDYVNHVMMNQNPGFMVIYSFLKDALLSKTGLVKVWWESSELEHKETYENLTDDQFALLAQAVLASDGGLEIVAHTVRDDKGPAGPYKCHDVTVLETKTLSQARVLGVPPEEFGIGRNDRTIRDANYVFHDVCTKSRSEWIEEGYDEDQVMRLPEYTGLQTPETLARDSVWEHASSGGTAMNNAAQIVKVTEHYVRMDYEGNGKPLLYQVVTGGDDGEILLRDGKLAVEEFDVIPFAACTPVPITHRFFGRSLADLVIFIQQQKTALKRGVLDNLYLHNNQRVVVSETGAGPNTLDDLMVSRPGGIVRVKGDPGAAIQWQVVPDITASIYPALQYLDAELETRTGLAKQTQGIDANALQNQSATAVNQVFSASQMRIKLLARILGEGVRDLFWLLHQVIQKNAAQAEQVYLRNQWVQVDPRNWKTRDHLTVSVALGTGGKAQQYAQTMALANVQKEFIQGGKGHMVPDDRLFNTAAELTKILGHKNPDRFFADPSAKDPQTGQLLNPPQPPAPDPKLQVEQMKAQNDLQLGQQKMQLEGQKSQADAEHQVMKTQADIALQREKAQLEAQLAMVDAQLKKDADARQAMLAQQEMQHKQIEHEHKMAQMQLSNAKTQSELHNENQKKNHATADHVKGSHDAIMKALGDHAKRLDEDSAAPVEIVRDKGGKAVGVKRGSRVMTIHRGPDGRPQKLQ